MKKRLFILGLIVATLNGGQRAYDAIYHPEVVYIDNHRYVFQQVFVDENTVVDIDD